MIAVHNVVRSSIAAIAPTCISALGIRNSSTLNNPNKDKNTLQSVNDTKQNFQNMVWEMDAPCFTTKVQEAVQIVNDYKESLKKCEPKNESLHHVSNECKIHGKTCFEDIIDE